MLGYQRRESLGSGGGSANQYGHVGGLSSSNQMVNPGESGLIPLAGAGGGSHGGFMPPESQLALNSMNAMLSSGSSVDEGRSGWNKGPASEMRPLDWISQSRRGKPLDLQENPLICAPASAASVKAAGGQKGDRTKAVGFSAAVNPSQRHGGLNSSNQMVTPWNVSVVPMAGTGTGGRGSFVPSAGGPGGSLIGEGGGGISISHFNQMGNPESNIPINTMNVMPPTGPPMDEGRGGWNSGPPPNEMRQMDWISHCRRGQHVGMEEKHMMHQRSHSYGQASRQMMPEHQFRKTTMANRGKPVDNKGPIKDLKKRKSEDVKVFTKDQKKQRSEAKPAGGEKKTKGDSSEKKTRSDNSSAATGTVKDQKQQKCDTTPAAASGQKGDEVQGDPKHSGKEDKAEQENVSPDENETMDDGSQKGAVEPLIPKEALKCHICEYYDFNSVKGFMNHLLSKNHEIIAHAYHAKGAAMLHLLRVQSKLAAQRHTLKSQKMGMRARITECTKCQCPVFGNLVEHMKTKEHMMVSDYTKCSLCQILFDNRISLENHRLSLRHLQESHSVTEEVKGQLQQVEKNLDQQQNQMEVNVDQDTLEKAVKVKKTEDGQIADTSKDDAVDQLKITHKDTLVWNVKHIPSYDPAVPTGLNFIEKEALFYCKVCQIKTMKTAKEARAHFSTPEHYENFVAHLKKLEENKEVEKIKQEKRVKEEKEEKINVKKENDEKQESTQVKVESEVKQSSEDVEDINLEDGGEDGEDMGNLVEETSGEGETGKHEDQVQAKEEQTNDDQCDEEASGDFDDILSMLEEVGEALPEDDETKKKSQSLPDNEDQESVSGDEEETLSKDKAKDASVDEPTVEETNDETETEAAENDVKAVSSTSRRGKGKGRGRGSKD